MRTCTREWVIISLAVYHIHAAAGYAAGQVGKLTLHFYFLLMNTSISAD